MFNPGRIQHATVVSVWIQTELPIKLVLKGKHTGLLLENMTRFVEQMSDVYLL
jgi:hypothetical protein